MPLKKPNAKDGLYDGLFNAEGKPTCMGMVGMEYVTTDEETGHQLWRCPSSGCHLLTEGTKAIKHCDTEFWFNPEDHLRVMGAIPRASKEWKLKYRKRWSIERFFYRAKASRLLETHRYRGLAKVTLHVVLSTLTLVGTSFWRGYSRNRRSTWAGWTCASGSNLRSFRLQLRLREHPAFNFFRNNNR